MLSDYKETEPIIYKQLKNSKKNLSHAYLFNLNGNVYAMDMIMSFVKEILCHEHKSKEEYEKCALCKRIDDGNFTEIKRIYPDGLWIKKEQLDDLQEEFSTKSLESDKRIYIIYEAEKLNKAAANSLLKFLEEPLDGIIAILVTNNINQMLNTITSRCRILTFNKNNVNDYIKYSNIDKNITVNKLMFTIWKIHDKTTFIEPYETFINNVVSFIEKYEKNKTKAIIYTKEYFHDKFKEKEDILKFYECMVYFYRDILNYETNGQVIMYEDYIDLIKYVANNNTIDQIINKLDVIINCESLVKNNLNTGLLIDRMIIDMEGLK